MSRVGWHLSSAATLVAVALLAAPLLAEQPDLSGTWEINKDLSEDPREKMHEAMKSRGGMGRGGGGFGGPGGGGFGGPGGGGFGGPGGGMGGRGGMGRGGGDMGGGRGGMMGKGAETLIITQADPELTIHFADGRQRWLHTDGTKQTRAGERGQADVQASWQGDQLVITTRTERAKVTETWELEPDSNQLVVTVKMDGRMGAVSFKRVYDAAKGVEVEDEEPPEE